MDKGGVSLCQATMTVLEGKVFVKDFGIHLSMATNENEKGKSLNFAFVKTSLKEDVIVIYSYEGEEAS